MTEGRGWPHEPVDRGGQATSVVVAEPVALSVRPGGPVREEPPALVARPAAFVALVVVLTVAALLAVFAVGDWWSRNHELDVLLTRITVAEQAQQPMQQAFSTVARDCFRGGGRCDVVGLQVAAQQSLPDLRATGEAVARTRIIRFHGALRDLRDRYVEHNAAWQAWLQGIVEGVTTTDQPLAIETTFDDAGTAAQRALPPFPTHDARSRVSAIFHR